MASNVKVSRATWWLVEGSDGYRTTCYQTRAEARFRLAEMAAEPWYYGDDKPVRQSADMFETVAGITYRVVKL